MWRGTTPVHNYTLPPGISLDDFAVVYLTYAQSTGTVLEKERNDLIPTDDGFQVVFSQSDSLKFSPGTVKIQLRASIPDGRSVASKIISTTAREVLKDGEI